MKTSNPIAVLISDVHYSLNTLALADNALRQAFTYARDNDLPLIIAGDLHDTKGLMRAECVNAMISTFKEHCGYVSTFVMVGNHDRINEKNKAHALEFLKPYATVVDELHQIASSNYNLYLLPYQSESQELQKQLDQVPIGSTIVAHCGVQSAHMGHYVQDTSSLPKESFRPFRVISGHYHKHQDVICGPTYDNHIGMFTYIGNPYTLNFGEANDGAKGFGVLYSNGFLELIPTNLRKHIVANIAVDDGVRLVRSELVRGYQPGDIVWAKITGPRSDLQRGSKKDWGRFLFGAEYEDFKLDLIPTDSTPIIKEDHVDSTDKEILDELINLLSDDEVKKDQLKYLWKKLVS